MKNRGSRIAENIDREYRKTIAINQKKKGKNKR